VGRGDRLTGFDCVGRGDLLTGFDWVGRGDRLTGLAWVDGEDLLTGFDWVGCLAGLGKGDLVGRGVETGLEDLDESSDEDDILALAKLSASLREEGALGRGEALVGEGPALGTVAAGGSLGLVGDGGDGERFTRDLGPIRGFFFKLGRRTGDGGFGDSETGGGQFILGGLGMKPLPLADASLFWGLGSVVRAAGTSSLIFRCSRNLLRSCSSFSAAFSAE